MRSGKDTFSDVLINQHGFEEFKFASGISALMREFFPDATSQRKRRVHYQHIGQAMRQLDPNIWVNYTDEQIKVFTESQEYEPSIVISDLRQPNEYKYAKENGYLVIKIEADEDVRINRAIKSNDLFDMSTLRHETELAVDDIYADICIYNNGTLEELMHKIELVMIVLFQAEVDGIELSELKHIQYKPYETLLEHEGVKTELF